MSKNLSDFTGRVYFGGFDGEKEYYIQIMIIYRLPSMHFASISLSPDEMDTLAV
jgi:hypothetical protein